MTKFVPHIKPRLLVFYFNFLDAWMVVFGPNQVWSHFGFDLNFEFARGPQVSLPSFFVWRTLAATLLPLPAATCVASHYTTSCHRLLQSLPPHTCMCQRLSGSTAQGRSRHLTACTPRRYNQPPDAAPLPCTHPRQAIECVASPLRSCFTRHFRLNTVCPPTRELTESCLEGGE
jgi:hypothetical protein